MFVYLYGFWHKHLPGNDWLIDPQGHLQNSSDQADCEFPRLLDGVCQDSIFLVDPDIVAVMVENNIEAQPLSGIASAAVVYESPVEGGIPRFLVLYPKGDEVEKVGPVRSARPYYLDWVAEYGTPMYMHVGGSPDALDTIVARNMFDLNEFYRGWYYWRGTDRSAPHNVYTSSELWESAYERYGVTTTPKQAISQWKFSSRDACVDTGCVFAFGINYGGAYDVDWKFNSTTRQYERSQFRGPHKDQDGTPYVADTVLIQEVDATILDNVGRLAIETIGEGKGYVARDGYLIPAIWKKQNVTDKTRWYDETGEQIALKAGKIWVEIVSQYQEVEISE